METKTAKFKRLFKAQDYRGALRIFKTFRNHLTVDEMRSVSIAWECTTGNESFYNGLGIDTNEMKMKAYNAMLEHVYQFTK